MKGRGLTFLRIRICVFIGTGMDESEPQEGCKEVGKARPTLLSSFRFQHVPG